MPRGRGTSAGAERTEIERPTARARFVWIAGNHDPAPPPAGWGEVAEEINDGPLIFRHEARFGPATGEISGHFHPVAASPGARLARAALLSRMGTA